MSYPTWFVATIIRITEDHLESLKTLYRKPETFSLKVDDCVWISKVKRTFKKVCLPNWTMELFTISRKVPGHNMYRIEDDHGEELEGTFYAQELQQGIKKDDGYEVEDVLAYKKRCVVKKIIPEVKVRWKRYSLSFHSWIPPADLILITASNGNFVEKSPLAEIVKFACSYSYALPS
jgi:hypothetical protein